ncbi:MAG: DUF2142 domain-containing protein [Candidatus Dormibacteria bacterium]
MTDLERAVTARTASAPPGRAAAGDASDAHSADVPPGQSTTASVASSTGASGRPRRAPRGLAALLLTVAYLMLGLTWVFTNPPGFAPDEPEHYLKALGISHGEVRGQPAPFTYLPVVDAAMLRWQNLNTRSIAVPAHLGTCLYYRVPVYDRCPEGPPPRTPARQTTYVASYPPFTYAGAALVMRLGHTTTSALLLGRLAMLLIATALLAGAAAVLSAARRTVLPLLGLLTAVTPMVLFASAELSASGLEIASGVAFAAALIRLAADESRPRGLWALLLGAGVVLALSRTFGPVWVLFDVIWALALMGSALARQRVGAARGWAAASAGAITVATMANLAWQLAVAPHPALTLAAVRHGVGGAVRGVPHLGREAIGVFGWIDVPLPRLAYLPWMLLVTVVLGGALRVSRPRERRLLLGMSAGIVGLTVLVAIAIAASAPGFKLQTRYVLPVAVALPLVAGELLYRHRATIDPRLLRRAVSAAILLAAAVQGWALLINARFYRRNVKGLVSFITPPGWRPPLGWYPWVALTAVGCAALLALALLAAGADEGREAGGDSGDTGSDRSKLVHRRRHPAAASR